MAENRDLEHHPIDLSNPEARHEHRDVNVWAIGKFAIGLVLLTIASIFMLMGVFRYFEMRENANQPAQRASGVNVDARKLPPEPRLQDSAVQDLQQMRAAEDQILSGYGWVDQQKGVVKIPIDRAIDLLAQRGLPARPPNGSPATASTVSIPGEAGLGPKVQQPGGPLADELAKPPSQGQESQTK